MKNNNWN